MREMKFRAWVNGSGIPRMIHWKDIDAIEFCNDKLWHHNGKYTLLGNLEFMQFIGVQDKGGQDVYEDDIVDTWPFYKHQSNCKGKGRYQRIIFSGGSFIPENFKFGWEGEGTIRIEHCTIVGNIYETPNLIPNINEQV